MSADRYFFLHIPKTAGTSLHRVLKEYVGPYFHQRYPHELAWPASTIWQRFRGCGGHTDWHSAEKLGMLSGFSLTFLRDPVERVISQYSFSRLAKENHGLESQLSGKYELGKLLRNPSGNLGAFWNAQTMCLSGLGLHEASLERHLEHALANLEKLSFVGTLETFGEDLIALTRLLGGSAAILPPHENRTPNRINLKDLDERTQELLVDSQAMDQLLYQRARELRGRNNQPALDHSTPLPTNWAIQLSPPLDESRITGAEIVPSLGTLLSSGCEAEIRIDVHSLSPLPHAMLVWHIYDVVGNFIAGTNTFLLTGNHLELPQGDYCLSFRFSVAMGPGLYRFAVALNRSPEEQRKCSYHFDFEVYPPPPPFREGMINLVPGLRRGRKLSRETLPECTAQQIRLQVLSKPDFSLTKIHLPIRVFNPGDCILTSTGSHPFYASYHWLTEDGKSQVMDGIRTSFPEALWPGESLDFPIDVGPPPASGRWCLQVRLVQEGVRWHEGTGFENSMPTNLIFVRHENGRCDFVPEVRSATGP